MGHRMGGQDEQTREEERVMWTVFSAVVGILMFVTGMGAGARWLGDSPARETQIPHSTIGANEVPNNLDCEEDEVIGFVQTDTPPYQLGCVQIDLITAEKAP